MKRRHGRQLVAWGAALALGAVAALAPGGASATVITSGTFSFSGSFTPSPDATDLSTATAVVMPSTNPNVAVPVVGGITGDFAGVLANGDSGIALSFPDFASAIPDYVVINGVSFSIGAGGLQIVNQSSGFLNLFADGFVTIAGDSEPGSLRWTGETNGGSFSFTATVTVPPELLDVPEPMSLALLGGGLFVLSLVRLRRPAAARRR